jgi:hypothetical protein
MLTGSNENEKGISLDCIINKSSDEEMEKIKN